MTPELLAKISTYCKDFDTLPAAQKQQQLSELVSNGIITQAELNEIMEGTIYAFQTTHENETTDSFSASSTPPESNTPTTPKQKYHPVFPFLALSEDGSIDMSQFTEENLRANYPSRRYKIEVITETTRPEYVITERKNKNNKIHISIKKDHINYKTESDGLEYNIADGKIISIKKPIKNNGSFTTYYDSGNLSNIRKTEESYPNGLRINTDYENNNIKFRKKSLRYRTIEREYYKDGKLDKIYNRDSINTYNASFERIIDSYNKILDGETDNSVDQTNNEDIIHEELSNFSLGTLQKFVQYLIYQDKNPSIILDIINKDSKLTDKKKQFITEFLNQCGVSPDNDAKMLENAKIAKSLKESLQPKNVDTEKFNETIDQLTPQNIIDILKCFNNDYKKGSLIPFDERSLIRFISLSNADESTKNEAINKIVSCLTEYAQNTGVYCQDIFDDISSTKDNVQKLDFNCQRLLNRLKRGQQNEISGEINGKLDTEFSQGNTGDCWLLAGITSILQTEEGRKFLDSLLTHDDENRILSVKIPYPQEKTYKIPYDRIYNSNYLVSGDPDIRGFEIAYEEIVKEAGYQEIEENPSNLPYVSPWNVDIDGGFATFAYERLLGNSKCEKNPDMTTRDFNDKNKSYTYSYTKLEEPITAYLAARGHAVKATLPQNHALVITKSDDKYVYFKNVWFEGNGLEIIVSRKAFKGRGRLESGEIPHLNE